MKKKILSFVLALVMVLTLVPALTSTAQAAPPSGSIIQDPNFYAAILDIIGKSDGHVITVADVSGIMRLNISDSEIRSLSGIEHFAALERLNCQSNQLTALDVRKNTSLRWLYCSYNQLTTLDISQNTALEILYCESNQLTTLDISENPELEILYCNNNKLSALDVSRNTALKDLRCFGNKLTALDVSRNTALEILWCQSNQLTALDVSNNAALTVLHCDADVVPTTRTAVPSGSIIQDPMLYAEVLSIIKKPAGHIITAADVSGITKLDVRFRGITDFSGIEHFTELSTLICQGNLLTELDVSRNTKLTMLICDTNLLTSLDVSNNPLLERLTVNGNCISSINLVTGLNPKLIRRTNFFFYGQSRLMYLDEIKAGWQGTDEGYEQYIEPHKDVGYMRVGSDYTAEYEAAFAVVRGDSPVKRDAILSVSSGNLNIPQKITTLAKSITQGVSGDYEKALAIHKWIANNIAYDHDLADYISRSYSFKASGINMPADTVIPPSYTEPLDVLEHKRTVCGGFAELNAILLQAVGIPAVYVSGNPTSDYDVGHAWNEIYTNGKWIITDVTNDSMYAYRDGIRSSKYADIFYDASWTGIERFDIELTYGFECVISRFPLEIEYKLVNADDKSLDTASTWAYAGITAAIGKGFVPAEIQGNYTNIITRQEFCRMAVQWVEYATGKDIDTILSEQNKTRDPNAFTDTNDPNILAAFALGITNGTGNNQFTPNGQFNREQAATMIRNTCKVIGMDTTGSPASDFVDLNEASTWAVDGINFVRANGIMQGVGNGKYDPKATFTREQSIITFNNIK